MKAVIVAAGVSSRLRPLTDSIHKTLLNLGGKTLLDRIVENLQICGITDIIVVTGYRAEQLRAALCSRHDVQVTFVHNPLFAETNNAYSLSLTSDVVADEPFVLLDSDILFDWRILQNLIESPYPDALALRTRGEVHTEDIKVIVDEQWRVTRIGKDVPLLEACGESIGIEKFTTAGPALFKILHKRIKHGDGRNEFYEAAFQEMIDAGMNLYAIDVADLPCIEIDTPEDLAAAYALAKGFS